MFLIRGHPSILLFLLCIDTQILLFAMFGLNAHGQSQFDANVAWVVISGSAVAIRLVCKIKSKQGIGSDDYCIVAALAFYWTAAAFAIWGQCNLVCYRDLMTDCSRYHYWRRWNGDEADPDASSKRSREVASTFELPRGTQYRTQFPCLFDADTTESPYSWRILLF